MKHEKMTTDQMQAFVRRMDRDHDRLCAERDSLLQEMKSMEERREILSWDEIASAVTYPKAVSDKECMGGGNPDEFKLLHQAERINKIYVSQMEELFDQLEGIEIQIAKHRYVVRCIAKLDKDDREFLDQFIRPDLTYERGMEIYHAARSTIYRTQKRVIAKLTEIYNN